MYFFVPCLLRDSENEELMHISKRTAFLKIAPINCLILARFILQIAIIGVAVQV